MRFRAPRATAAGLSFMLLASACSGGSTASLVETSDSSPSAATSTEGAPVAPATTEPVEISPTESTSTEAVAPPATAVSPTTVPPTTVPPTTVPEPTAVTAPAEIAVQLPRVDVVNLATGQIADLPSFSKPGPTLVWFWAPH